MWQVSYSFLLNTIRLDNILIVIIFHQAVMKDQQMQAMQGFSGKYKQFQITLRLSSEDSSLEIRVEDSDSLERHVQIIDATYIAQTKDFINIFEEPIEILDYFIHNFEQISVQGESIKFQYTFGSIKKRVKAIVIPLKKVEVDPLELANLRVEKIKEYYKNDMMIKDAKIASLQQENRRIEAENCNLMEQMRTCKKMRDNYEKDSKEVREMLEKCMNEIGELKSSKEEYKFMHIPDNPHSKFYDLQNKGSSSARLIFKNSGGKWYNFINKAQVSTKTRVKYSVKLSKITNKWLMVGFCNKFGLGVEDNYKSSESVYYNCAGSIFQGGAYHPLTETTSTGETIECVADYYSHQFLWIKKGKVITARKIPLNLQGCAVYFSVIICTEGDEVELYV